MGRITRIEVAGREPARLLAPGESRLALPSPQPWNAKDRTAEVYGLVVHTTGAGLVTRAHDEGVYPTIAAARWYEKSHGTHYVCGYRGLDGDLIQVANERERANGVGMSVQLAAGAGWRGSVPSRAACRAWDALWGAGRSPVHLFPGQSANNVYVHVEMPPAVISTRRGLVELAAPWGYDGRFTTAQHKAIVALAIDIATRYAWPAGWHRSGRLVGHEDLSPLTRSTRAGCWDPGFLRAEPWFDFELVRALIDDHYGDPDAPARV